MTANPDPLVAAIQAEGVRIACKDAKELAAIIRMVVEQQPLQFGGSGHEAPLNWPTRCFSLAQRLYKLQEQVDERRSRKG